MLKFWERTSSSNVRKVIWCLKELEPPLPRAWYERLLARPAHRPHAAMSVS